MFGILKHAGCAMAPEQHREWTGHICGLCLALKQDYGQFSRLTTNYDAALLSALYDAQLEQPQHTSTNYCPLRKSFKTKVFPANTPGTRYAASIALMMAASKIKDHLQDNETSLRYIRGMASNVAQRWMRSAGKTARGLGFSPQSIEEQIQRQTLVEAQDGETFFHYSNPTECAVGAAFAHTAALAGQPANEAPLQHMGRMFGRIMYLLDSFEDYREDKEAQRFNALAAAFPEKEWRRQAGSLFQQAHAELQEGFLHLQLARPALLQALLIKKLHQKGRRSLQICRGTSTSCHTSARSAGNLFQRVTSFSCIPPCQQDVYVHENKKRNSRKSWRDGDSTACECCCDCCPCDCCCDSPIDCDCCDCDCCSGCDCCGACDCGC